MGIQLEVDPARLKSLRSRLKMPRHAGAKRAKVSESQLERWETEATELPVDTLQKLARAYNRNWYVFLLEDEVGKPAVPHDFRRPRGGALKLSPESLLAFDNAWLLLDKIEALSDAAESGLIVRNPAQVSDDPEQVAARFAESLTIDRSAQGKGTDAYASLRAWVDALTEAGIYVSQVAMPPSEVRAFCLSRHGTHLVVLSNSEVPAGRTFSLVHEVGHLLLGTDAMCRPDDVLPGQPSSHEPWCNQFAAAVLMPKASLEANPKFQRLAAGEIEVGSGRALAKELGVSELALFRRLQTLGYISVAKYQQLQAEADRRWKERGDQTSTGFLTHPKKVINKESPLFVRRVLDAHSAGDLSYREIGTLLNAPLRSIPRIREEIA